MDRDSIIFQTNWITVKESPRGFQYLERKGKDSVAVFLLKKSNNSPLQYQVLVRQQHLCIDNSEAGGRLKLFPCPITGAVYEGESPEATAVREAYEETGYQVQVLPFGKYVVGTQINEICYLYYVYVTQHPPDPPQQGSYLESLGRNKWCPYEELKNYDYAACQIGYFRLREILFQ